MALPTPTPINQVAIYSSVTHVGHLTVLGNNILHIGLVSLNKSAKVYIISNNILSPKKLVTVGIQRNFKRCYIVAKRTKPVTTKEGYCKGFAPAASRETMP